LLRSAAGDILLIEFPVRVDIRPIGLSGEKAAPMRYTAFVALIAAVASCGCSNGPDTSHVSSPADVAKADAPAVPPSPAQITAQSQADVVSTPVPYPERTEVERLLFRARELEHKHQFQSALALVGEALRHDPHSPAALAMKGHLEAIVERI
jgi:hypothetical protein